MSIIDKRFRLADHAGGAGWHCSATGVSLAGTPLLHEAALGLEPRPEREIKALLKAAYDADGNPAQVRARLTVAAEALNQGDLPRAMVAVLQMRLPGVDQAGAERLSRADQALRALAKYDPDEPRDWRGRWTNGAGPFAPAPKAKPARAAAKPASRAPHAPQTWPKPQAALGVRPDGQAQRPRPVAPAPPADGAAGGGSLQAGAQAALAALQSRLERRYDFLGPTEFADRTTRFAQWLEGNGAKLNSQDRAGALAEYVFLQDRLSFWLGYQLKSPKSHNALLSAASLLFQASQNTHLVGPDLPKSMQGVVVGAMAYDGPSGEFSVRRPSGGPPERLPTSPGWTEPLGEIGGVVSNDDVGIVWDNGILKQGRPWEIFHIKKNLNLTALHPNSKVFDALDQKSGAAISLKTLNTQSRYYINN